MIWDRSQIRFITGISKIYRKNIAGYWIFKGI